MGTNSNSNQTLARPSYRVLSHVPMSVDSTTYAAHKWDHVNLTRSIMINKINLSAKNNV